MQRSHIDKMAIVLSLRIIISNIHTYCKGWTQMPTERETNFIKQAL